MQAPPSTSPVLGGSCPQTPLSLMPAFLHPKEQAFQREAQRGSATYLGSHSTGQGQLLPSSAPDLRTLSL